MTDLNKTNDNMSQLHPFHILVNCLQHLTVSSPFYEHHWWCIMLPPVYNIYYTCDHNDSKPNRRCPLPVVSPPFIFQLYLFSSIRSRELLTLAFPSVTGASFGKQLQTITNPQYANANALMGNPNRPKLHRAGGRDLPWMRFKRTHPILIM